MYRVVAYTQNGMKLGYYNKAYNFVTRDPIVGGTYGSLDDARDAAEHYMDFCIGNFARIIRTRSRR